MLYVLEYWSRTERGQAVVSALALPSFTIIPLNVPLTSRPMWPSSTRLTPGWTLTH